ncbi:unnamed protein product [Larinioides sclopetarius]|uniref:C2H2-type domain-containing protein n=1 Tax=Larinioides sclopetarius TaxID=280406 RepID=A0AAV2B672_9ARAC
MFMNETCISKRNSPPDVFKEESTESSKFTENFVPYTGQSSTSCEISQNENLKIKHFERETCEKPLNDRKKDSSLQIHKNEKPFICNICGQNFPNKSSLKTHSLIHKAEGEKRFVCEICSKAFSYISNLKSHLLIHFKEKPHVCEICNKAFTLKNALKSHMVTHTKIKSHVCDICSKAFALKQALISHLLIHTKEKPHICQICNKAFTQSSNLKSHMLIHTKEKPHVCEICSKAFALRLVDWPAVPITVPCGRKEEEARKTEECHYCGKVVSQCSVLKADEKRGDEWVLKIKERIYLKTQIW